MKKNIAIITLSLILVILSCYILLSNPNEDNICYTNNEYIPTLDYKNEKIINSIKNYLIEEAENNWHVSSEEKAFVSMKAYLIEETKEDIYNVYAWVILEKYYQENGSIIKESGYSIPHKFTVEKLDEDFLVTGYETPKDGTNYKSSMAKIFPSDINEAISNAHYDKTIENLINEIEQQVEEYYS